MNKSSIKETLKNEGYLIYPTCGISMYPLLYEGKDMVCLNNVSHTTELNIGDVVLFERNNRQLVLHRIVGINRKKYIICGDNCINGETVCRKSILARMTGIYHGTEYVNIDTDTDYRKYTEQKIAEYGHRTDIKPNVDWIALITLLSYAIRNKGIANISDKANWENIYSLSKKHGITCTVFYAIDKTQCPDELYKKWENKVKQNISKTILFDNERASILEDFAKENIRCVLLKGVLLSELYPKNGMREFTDNDILIDECNSEKVKAIMSSRGYSDEHPPAHDSYYKQPIFNFEIHKHLFVNVKKFYGYFSDITERIIQDNENPNIFRFNDDDFYLYFLAHLYKHLYSSGTGLRYLADLWLLDRYYEENNICIDLKKTEILFPDGFQQRISELSKKIFEDTDMLTVNDISYIMLNGNFGTFENKLINMVKEKGRAAVFLKKLFLPYRDLCLMFPIIKYLPFLYPFCWILRLFIRIFDKKSRKILIIILKQ